MRSLLFLHSKIEKKCIFRRMGIQEENIGVQEERWGAGRICRLTTTRCPMANNLEK